MILAEPIVGQKKPGGYRGGVPAGRSQGRGERGVDLTPIKRLDKNFPRGEPPFKGAPGSTKEGGKVKGNYGADGGKASFMKVMRAMPAVRIERNLKDFRDSSGLKI